MRDRVTIRVDGRNLVVARGTTVAAALLSNEIVVFHTSVSGEPRGPLCAMGVCFECRVTIDGKPEERACMALCGDGMEILTRG